jgi:hypothetical protein
MVWAQADGWASWSRKAIGALELHEEEPSRRTLCSLIEQLDSEVDAVVVDDPLRYPSVRKDLGESVT